MESLGLIVSVDTSRADPPSAHIRLNGGDPGCCYFAGAAGSMTIDPHNSLYRVPLFRGAGARGSLFIENERMGTLYLRFHLP